MDNSEQDLKRLETFMAKRGYSMPDLARETCASYQTVYQMLRVRRKITDGWKWAFYRRFGPSATVAVFGADERWMDEN